MGLLMRIVDVGGALGAGVRWVADLLSELVMFGVLLATPGVWGRSPIRKAFFRQMRQMAVRALPFVLLVGAVVGATALVRVIDLLRLSGSSDDLAPTLLLALMRDPSPILVNLIVFGRSGSAIVAETAGMRASGSDRLLGSHGVDLFRFVVIPRTAAMAVAVVGLSVLLNATALCAAMAINTISDATTLSDWQLINAMARDFAWSDAAGFLIRAALPAMLGGLIACRIGLTHDPQRRQIAETLPGFFTLSISALAVVTLLTTLVGL